MMGGSRINGKGKAPAYANSFSPNVRSSSSANFLEGNVDIDDFGSILEPVGNPRAYSINPNGLQNLQTNLSSTTTKMNFQEVPLLSSDWNMGSGQEYMNQGHNAVFSGGISASGGESSFGSFNRPQVNRDVTGSSFSYHPRDTAPVHTRNNVNCNTDQSGVQGKFEGGFLSLGLGVISETVSSSHLDSREISDRLKEATSNKLKTAQARKTTSKTFNGGFVGSQSSNSDEGFMGSSHHHISKMQQNDRQLGRSNKLTEAASSALKMAHSQKATRHTLDADFMALQRNNIGFSNQFSYADQMTLTNEVGVHSTSNSGLGSSRHHILQMQQNDSSGVRSVDLDHYKCNQSVHSGTLGGNSVHFFNSQQHNLKPPEFVRPSRMASYYTPSEQLQHFHSTTANNPNCAGQVMPQNATPTQVLGGNLFSQRTATPQVSWVGRGLAGTDAPFPKRLGIESSVRDIPQSSRGHLAPMGPSLQKINTGQICQSSDKGSSTHMSHNVLRPTGRNDGAPLSYPVNYQEPYFTYGQSHNELIQLPKGPQGAPSTNASSVSSQSQKLDFHVKRHHKRTAVAPQSVPSWVQRQKIIHPIIHHSMSKPPIPVTTALGHPSMPVRSRTQPMGPIAAHIPPVVPCVSNVKSRVHVASAPAVSRITWKALSSNLFLPSAQSLDVPGKWADPDATSRLSGYKCFLCKRDLALTSEGTMFQPAVSPPVAVLPCGHTFHDQCLQNITPDDQAKDPPCIPCAIGEN